MRYREIYEFVNTLDQDQNSAEKSAANVVDRVKNTKVSQTQNNDQLDQQQSQKITVTPQLRAAITDSIPKQSDPRREAQMFDLILNQITDVDKFLAINHSDIRHYLSTQLADHTIKVDGDEVRAAMKQSSLEKQRIETSRESDNNYLRQAGDLLTDDIYRVTMTYQDERGTSHIDQSKLDDVSKNEGKRYSAKKFDHTIRTQYNTDTYVVILIENLDEASTYLIILCDLLTGKIYCGRKYARLILVTTDSGGISRKRVRSKIVYNENSPAQQALFRTVVPQIESYDAYMKNRDYEGLFVGLDVVYNRQVPVKQQRE